MGDFVIPILTSSTQLDQYIWAASKALIHVLWHIIHPISHPQHSWKSGRASTRRWHVLPTKSPLSYIAFDMTKNIDDGVSESHFPTSYINYSIPSMSGTIWSRGSCHLLLRHCIRSKLNIGDRTSDSYFPNINTLYLTIQEYLMYCIERWQYVVLLSIISWPLCSYLLHITPSLDLINTNLCIVHEITFPRLSTKLGYMILIDAPTHHCT